MKRNKLTIMYKCGETIRYGQTGKRIKGRDLVYCECDCGGYAVYELGELKKGKIKSCGCHKRNLKTTHGKSKMVEYKVWKGIKTRCTNPNQNRKKHYVEKGVKMCDRWFNSFENFLEDMGERPSKDHQIHRINNDGNYEPSNCVWIDKIEHGRIHADKLHKKAG